MFLEPTNAPNRRKEAMSMIAHNAFKQTGEEILPQERAKTAK